MEIIDENLTSLEQEIIEIELAFEKIIKVKNDKELNKIILNHFGTLEIDFEKYLTNEGILKIIYPSEGIYNQYLFVLITNF